MELIDIVIGVDPDSDKNGVAVFFNKKLSVVANHDAFDFYGYVEWLRKTYAAKSITVCIENVKANSFMYARNSPAISKSRDKMAASYKMGIKMGMCHQAQTEIERACDRLGVELVKMNPCGSAWGKNKGVFEKQTGWTGRSNKDNRMAAFFGWLYIKSIKK